MAKKVSKKEKRIRGVYGGAFPITKVKSREPKYRHDYTYEKDITVYRHNIHFWFRGDHPINEALKARLNEAAEERVKACLQEEYSSGELNYEDEKYSLRGWWTIQNG